MMVTTAGQDHAGMRRAMVASQLRPTAVTDQRVIAAMARVPREDFLPAEASAVAYRDTAVALGSGRRANVPLATARLLDAAQIVPDDRVLLIGAAGGYTTALLADMGARVVGVESDPALVAIARTALATTAMVEIVEAPLVAGAPRDAAYDVLVIDGAVEHVPVTLLDQLRPGARVVTGLVDNGVTRLAAGYRSAGGFALQPFLDSDCVILPGFAAPAAFRF